ncbi:MAG: hypothetical protein AAFX06_19255 [Planctomycetota bacterium]
MPSPLSDFFSSRTLSLQTLLPPSLLILLAIHITLPQSVSAIDPSPAFADDFEKGLERWEILDPETWQLGDRDGSKVAEITKRSSAYEPPVRSPRHVALMKDVEVGSFELTFRVKSTKDTGGHRDCCVFFNYQDDQHFYYVHLGAVPDPHSGQIMIVNEAPRLALTKNERQTPWDDQWHNVKLTRDVVTGEIAVYFDDMSRPHMKVRDTTFSKGRIGLGSFDDLNAFDDVVLIAK